jgi:hypothetical protein
MATGRHAIISGDRADGTQQRLRFALGEFVPYRWRGVPGWNPASVLDGRRGPRKSRECEKCCAGIGKACLNASGKEMRGYHTGR